MKSVEPGGKHGAARVIVLAQCRRRALCRQCRAFVVGRCRAAEAAIDQVKAKSEKEEFVRFTQQFAKE